MAKFQMALAAGAALVLSACYPPTTSHPVGTTVGQKPDPVLAGLWKGTPVPNQERGGYFHFLPRVDGTIVAVLVQTGEKPDADWNIVELTTTKLGANRFMNARLLMSNGKPEKGSPGRTIPVLYHIDANGQMTLTMMDEKATKDAIKAGEIKGSVGQGEMGDAIITADPAALDKFMRSSAALALFSKPFFTLHKME